VSSKKASQHSELYPETPQPKPAQLSSILIVDLIALGSSSSVGFLIAGASMLQSWAIFSVMIVFARQGGRAR